MILRYQRIRGTFTTKERSENRYIIFGWGFAMLGLVWRSYDIFCGNYDQELHLHP